jgi:5-methyltetrahydropteroyltriglutamate--homocysteine methyltransferase
MALASKALALVTRGLTCLTITHLCYGDFATVFDQLLHLPVDMLDLEMANSNYDTLELFRSKPLPDDKSISMGVLDVHNHRVETVEEIKRGIRLGLEVFPPERLYIDPDCGLKTRTEEEAVAKLRNMMAAVREVKRELGLGQ